MSERVVDTIDPREVNEIYQELGVTKVVNACFLSTILGGSSLPNEVFEAAQQANDEFAWLWEMEEEAGETIAELTGAEAAHVTTGTYGGMVVSAAACMAGTDRQKKAKLPADTSDIADEFLIQKCVRNLKYNRAVETAGGTYVPVGDRSGCTVEDVEAAITDDTASIVYMAPGPGDWPGPDYVKGEREGFEGAKNAVPIEEMIELAHDHDLPIILDAAGQTYPVDGLRRYVGMGADLVCYSGKYVTGPNAAGFVIGKEEYVEAAFHNNFIGDETYGFKRPEKVEYLPDDEHTEKNKPRDPLGKNMTYGVGRGYKLDRFDIVAVVEALKRWVDLDHEAERFEPARERGEYVLDRLAGHPKVEMTLGEHHYHNVPLDVVFTDWGESDVEQLKAGLLEADPMVYPRAIDVTDNGHPEVCLNMLWLQPREEKIVADRLEKLLK
jgi:L-seryl-tRNA(Ser) seleniumtransferase